METEKSLHLNGLHKTENKVRRRTSLVSVQTFLQQNAFVILTVAAVFAGVILGYMLRSWSPKDVQSQDMISFPGEILMRMLQMLVLPLIVSSLITGISSLDNNAGRMGLQALTYYMLTTLIAVFTGIVLVLTLQPGKRGSAGQTPPGGGSYNKSVQATDAFLDLIRNMFPSNILEACFKQYKTSYKTTSAGLVPTPGSSSGVNALGLVVFSIAFGAVLGRMGEQGRPLRKFFHCLNDAIMQLVGIVIWYAPVGILFLIAGKIREMEDLGQMGSQLLWYMLCVVLGLLIHSLLLLPLLYFLATWKNPYLFIAGLLQALLTALGTSSSSASLPITFRCLEENNGVDKRVSRFMLPVGATVNMDGTALYEAVAAIFIAQVADIELTFVQVITISVTATAASIGAAGIPQAGLVTMVIVLTSVNLPTELISVIIAVDWLLDRLRTVTNVLGDSLGVGIVSHLSRKELQSRDNTTANHCDAEGGGMSGPFENRAAVHTGHSRESSV
ncbi:excitatory amino acid transporter 1-like [Sardina pilchardus]|uniref:excitatory amino acid transporter 1-like n=1 Tax=Sardina pilchardus TaxID=27697 RepID=UPI002E1438F1